MAESLRNKSSSLLAISTACFLAPLLPTSARQRRQLRLKVDDSSIKSCSQVSLWADGSLASQVSSEKGLPSGGSGRCDLRLKGTVGRPPASTWEDPQACDGLAGRDHVAGSPAPSSHCPFTSLHHYPRNVRCHGGLYLSHGGPGWRLPGLV